MRDPRLQLLPAALIKHKWVFYRAMQEVGYSESHSRNPYFLTRTKAYKKVMEPFLKQLEQKRDMALASLTENKMKVTNGVGTATVVDILTKNIQLLSGKATERVDHMSDKSDDELNAILNGTPNGSVQGTSSPGTSS